MPTLESRIENIIAGDDKKIIRTITLVPAGRTLLEAWFTVKEDAEDVDTEAIIQKDISTSDVPGTGQITDDGADGTGAVRFDLTDADTLLMDPTRDYDFDIQVELDDNDLQTPELGKIRTRRGVTKATT